MADPYAVLGVPKDATQEDIRVAYRRLAKENHPDLNPGDEAAEKRFKDLTAAYDILGDKDKRAKFDRGEIDEAGAERSRFSQRFAEAEAAFRFAKESGFKNMSSIDDLLAEMMARQGPPPGGAGGKPWGGGVDRRGANVSYRLEISFAEAANGTTKRVETPDGRTLDVIVPGGIEDGQTLRLRGQGKPNPPGTPPSDAMVDITVVPHPTLVREGFDVHGALPVTLSEAVNGEKVPIETVTGTVTVTVPKGASTGTKLRLRGKGILNSKAQTRGDHYANLEVVLPPHADDALATFLRSWEGEHPYNPRKPT